jgi:excisionase family DNA binding protein
MTREHRNQPEGLIMSQTRAKPRKTRASGSKAVVNGLVDSPTAEVFTLSEAAAYLRVTETDLMRLVHDQALPGRQFGIEWRFLKSAIQDWLKTPPKPGSREAVLSSAGCMKGDPYLMEELKEVYRKRGRPMTEDGE